MYELIVLSLLMRFPLHGYLLAQIANDTIGPWAKLSNGTLYPLLSKLEQGGLITPAADASSAAEEQTIRSFTIAPAGIKRFYKLMMDTTSNIGDYQRIFHLKVPYLDLLEPRERLHLLNHYIAYSQATLLHIHTHADNLKHELAEPSGAQVQFRTLALELMKHRATQWQAEMEWTLALRERFAALDKSE